MNRIAAKIPWLVMSLTISTNVIATELVYQPVNPNFGGSPLNGAYLLNNAQSQNKHKDPSSRSTAGSSELDRFTSILQSRLLSQLLADVGNGNTGGLETDQFSIVIGDDGIGGLSVLINDKETGESTTISVNGLVPDQ